MSAGGTRGTGSTHIDVGTSVGPYAIDTGQQYCSEYPIGAPREISTKSITFNSEAHSQVSKLGVLPRVARLIWGNDLIACSLGFAQSPLLGLNNSRLPGAVRTAHRHPRSGLLAHQRFHSQIRPFQLHFSHLRLAIPSYKVSQDVDTCRSR